MEMNQTKTGSTMLKVTGILMIIGGALSLVLAIIALAGFAALVGIVSAGTGANLTALLIIASIVALAGSVIELIAGIAGVKHWANPAKAQTCVTWSIVIIVLSVLSNILSMAGGSDLNLFSMLLGLVLPVLYLIGALQLKNQA